MSLFSGPSAFATLTFFNAATANADAFLKLYKQYPDLFTFKTFFGGPPIIMVNSYDLIKKLFVQNAESFSNRPKLGWLGEKLTKGKGMVFLHIIRKRSSRMPTTRFPSSGGASAQSPPPRTHSDADPLPPNADPPGWRPPTLRCRPLGHVTCDACSEANPLWTDKHL